MGKGMEMMPFPHIFNVVLEDIVKEAISELVNFVKCHEMLAKKNDAMQKAEYKRLKLAVERDEKCIKILIA